MLNNVINFRICGIDYMYMLLLIHRDMFKLLEIRRAEFNKNLENPLHDGILRFGGGGKIRLAQAF